MEMTVRQEERCLEIALIGELDHHAARKIGGRLDRVSRRRCRCGWCWTGPG